MEIAIIGTGKIGGALARHWQAAGHSIQLGARDPSDAGARQLADEVDGRLSGVADAVPGAEVVALAVPGQAVLGTVSELSEALAGKTIVVPANDMSRATPNLAQAVAGAVPRARVIRAFNTIPVEALVAGELAGEPVDMLYVSSAEADEIAVRLISQCGLRPIRVGDLDKGGMIDDLFALWATLAFGGGHGRGIVFALRGF